MRAYKLLALTIGILSLTWSVSVRADLIVHYEFSGNSVDTTGNGNDGTLNGSLSFSASPLGQSVFLANPSGFGAATDFVSLPNNFAGLENSSFSIAVRMRSLDTSQVNGRLFGNNFSQSGVGIGYNREATANAGIFVRDNTTGAFFFDTAAGPEGLVTDGDWHWMGMVVDRTNNMAYAFIDDVVNSQGIAGLGSISLSDLRIGSLTNPSAFGDSFGAKDTWVDDFRIYNHALSSSEILSLPITAVPEPSSLMLVVAAVSGFALRRKRSSRSSNAVG